MFDTHTTKSVTAQTLHDRDVHVLDVREDDEWQAGHLPGAHHLPLSQLERRLHELDPDEPTVVVCRSGRRSGQVAKKLTRRGYDAADLEGRLQAWTHAGLPLTAADGAPGKVI